jgi:uncharacterized protein YpmB
MKKRGQGIIEFVVLFGVALLFFVVIMASIQEKQSQRNKEKERIIVQNIALDVQDEINLAAGSSDGYRRNFQIPANILGKDYEIEITQGYVVAKLDGYIVDYEVFNVTGLIIEGDNLIRKENGIVYLN